MLTSDVRRCMGGQVDKFSMKFASRLTLRRSLAGNPCWSLAVGCASDTEVSESVIYEQHPAVIQVLERPDIRAVAERHGWVSSKSSLLYDWRHVLHPVNLRSCSIKQSFSSSRRMYVLNSLTSFQARMLPFPFNLPQLCSLFANPSLFSNFLSSLTRQMWTQHFNFRLDLRINF